MAHYAFLDNNNFVTEVINGRDETEVVEGISNWEEYYGSLRNQVCKRTSYSGRYRKNFAGIDFYYDESFDAFIPPKPFASWILNEDTCLWEAPVAYPTDGEYYLWNEQILSWEQRL